MPIYAYRCAECGHTKDVLQKLSDPVLTTCPSCGAQAFQKQLTAAGFQLKGSGWYATDFKGGASNNASTSPKNGDAASAPAPAADSSSKNSSSSDKPSASAGCGSSCACH